MYLLYSCIIVSETSSFLVNLSILSCISFISLFTFSILDDVSESFPLFSSKRTFVCNSSFFGFFSPSFFFISCFISSLYVLYLCKSSFNNFIWAWTILNLFNFSAVSKYCFSNSSKFSIKSSKLSNGLSFFS